MTLELIVMLTFNDQTVENALDLFRSSKDIPVKHWGFKDVGLPKNEMKALVADMKGAGKTTCLEVVSLSEEKGIAGAKLALECEFDVLMGTIYYPSIKEILLNSPVKYFPFAGNVEGHPSVLKGSQESIVADALRLENEGVDGIDLLTYRYTGSPADLLEEVVSKTSIPIVSAGSISSIKRISEVRATGAWGFTIGTAFINRSFVSGGSFSDNLSYVCDWLVSQNNTSD